MSKIKVMLVDDQRLMRDGLRILLELEPDIEIVGEAENGEEAVQKYEALLPDVVLMDVRMPVMTGVEATKELLARWPDACVVILTTFDDDQYIFDALRAGALGYLLKDVSGDELADAVRTVAAGGSLIEPSVARKLVSEFARLSSFNPGVSQPLNELLNDRELEILQFIGGGLSNKEISARMHLSTGTVKNYVSQILKKLDVRDRTQAALIAQNWADKG